MNDALSPSHPPRKAEREGAVVAEMLTKGLRLKYQGKVADAAALRETVPKGNVLGASALNNGSGSDDDSKVAPSVSSLTH